MINRLAIVPILLLSIGCAHSGHASGARAVAPASAAQKAALLGKIKSLEGTWAMEGNEVASEYKVSSGGHVVRQVMFPGAQHEMTNVYHMDGDALVMTHYCAVGNQPRMRASHADGNTIAFTFESVTNMTSPDQACMRELTIEFKDHDHIVERWKAYEGEKSMHEQAFAYTRIH